MIMSQNSKEIVLITSILQFNIPLLVFPFKHWFLLKTGKILTPHGPLHLCVLGKRFENRAVKDCGKMSRRICRLSVAHWGESFENNVHVFFR